MNTTRILTVCLAAMRLAGLLYAAPAAAAMLAGGSVALAAEPAAGKNAPAPGIAAKVLELTGAETRVVWLRLKQWEGRVTDTVDGGAGYSIMAFDTGGKDERELVPQGEHTNRLMPATGLPVPASVTLPLVC